MNSGVRVRSSAKTNGNITAYTRKVAFEPMFEDKCQSLVNRRVLNMSMSIRV